MGVSIFLARRLSLSSNGKKTSPAVNVAIAAITLSIIIMIWAIAIVTGFKNEITSKITGFNSDISIIPYSESGFEESEPSIISLTPSLRKLLDSESFISDYALQAAAPAILKTSDDFKGVYLKSLSGKSLEKFISTSIDEGSIPAFSADSCKNDIIISRKAADRLGLKPGDKIDTYFMTDGVSVRRLNIKGIYNSHFDNYDDNYAYASLSLIQDIAKISDTKGTSISVSVTDFNNVDMLGASLQRKLIEAYKDETIYQPYQVLTARKSGAAYFQWLDMLDMNVIVVLVLMTIVACITLVSGMLILMVDKIRFIALMSALGAPRKIISRIFMLMAAKIALTGILLGNIIAWGTLLIQKKTHFLPLDPESYYIDFVPVKITLSEILILDLVVLIIIWLVLILPSRFAGKAAPARTLATE